MHTAEGGCHLSIPAWLQSYQLYPLRTTALQLARCYERQQQWSSASLWSQTGLQIESAEDAQQQSEDLIRRARISRAEQDMPSALRFAALASQHDKGSAFACYLTGVYLQEIGDVANALDAYSSAVRRSPGYAQARINAAAMFQIINDLPSAIDHYRYVLDRILVALDAGSDIYCMAKANLGVAYFQSGQPANAIQELEELAATLTVLLTAQCPVETESYRWLRWLLNENIGTNHSQQIHVKPEIGTQCEEILTNLGVAMMHLTTVKKSICDWKNMESNVHGFLLPLSLRNYERHVAGDTLTFGPLLPFDSLLLPFSLNSRLKIAIIRSAAISRASPSLEAFKTTGTALAPGNKADKVEKKRNIPLKLGFLSYDFNNHPTAHLIEAIFAKVVQCRGAQRLCDDVHIGMLNYGPNDQSEYRHRLENLADSVYDMPLQSHLQSAELIQRAGVDVLLDLQLHTLGNRAEIVAAHPAPIVVNYLVYPGTCGSTQHEYIVVDKTVVPPEHCDQYSEKLLLLPPSYQISTYDNINVSIPIRKDNREANGPIIKLCNFNKIDKLDLESLTIWMQMLRRFPRSRLQLLDPVKKSAGLEGVVQQSTSSADNIRAHMIAHGVLGGRVGMPIGMHDSSSRLEVVERMSKEDHIKRQASSDLFIDTVVYGAHSTATDALRAGLPVLTVRGDSFPNRVATSLYESFEEGLASADIDLIDRIPPGYTLADMLVGHSLKEFEDMAVLLMSQRGALRRLSNELAATVTKRAGIFDSARQTAYFLHGMESIAEVKAALGGGSPPNVVFTGRAFPESDIHEKEGPVDPA